MNCAKQKMHHLYPEENLFIQENDTLIFFDSLYHMMELYLDITVNPGH